MTIATDDYDAYADADADTHAQKNATLYTVYPYKNERAASYRIAPRRPRRPMRHCTARRARRGFPTHRNGNVPARFISRVTSVDGTQRFACIEEVERGADGADAGARD